MSKLIEKLNTKLGLSQIVKPSLKQSLPGLRNVFTEEHKGEHSQMSHNASKVTIQNVEQFLNKVPTRNQSIGLLPNDDSSSPS
jgi:hypothetical protein